MEEKKLKPRLQHHLRNANQTSHNIKPKSKISNISKKNITVDHILDFDKFLNDFYELDNAKEKTVNNTIAATVPVANFTSTISITSTSNLVTKKKAIKKNNDGKNKVKAKVKAKAKGIRH